MTAAGALLAEEILLRGTPRRRRVNCCEVEGEKKFDGLAGRSPIRFGRSTVERDRWNVPRDHDTANLGLPK